MDTTRRTLNNECWKDRPSNESFIQLTYTIIYPYSRLHTASCVAIVETFENAFLSFQIEDMSGSKCNEKLFPPVSNAVFP